MQSYDEHCLSLLHRLVWEQQTVRNPKVNGADTYMFLLQDPDGVGDIYFPSMPFTPPDLFLCFYAKTIGFDLTFFLTFHHTTHFEG